MLHPVNSGSALRICKPQARGRRVIDGNAATHMRHDVLLHPGNVVVACLQRHVGPDVVDSDEQRPRIPASLLDHNNTPIWQEPRKQQG